MPIYTPSLLSVDAKETRRYAGLAKAEFDEETNEFKNVQVRSEEEKIMFYYEGSEEQFKRLDPKTQLEITNNASTIIYNVKYNPCYSK